MSNIGYIQVTRICNHDCLFCSNPENGKMKSVEEVKKAIDDFVRRDYRGIIFTGGEPTIYPQLTEVMQYASDQGIESRIITNGSMLAKKTFAQKLIDAGLTAAHISLYSYKEDIHDFLSNVDGAYKQAVLALKNLKSPQVAVSVNTVINKYNADHLDKNILFILKNFPYVNHFVWNNMDTLMITEEKKLQNPTWAQLPEFEKSLSQAVKYIQGVKKTFRVEKVPLCYMQGFEEFSTETRKIVQEEERRIYFLDERETTQQEKDMWKYSKNPSYAIPKCKECDLYDICAGLHRGDEIFNPEDLKPCKKGKTYKEAIIQRVFQSSENK